MSSVNHQQFTVAARDTSVPLIEIKESLQRVISATSGARLVDLDPNSKIAVVEIPAQLVAAVRNALGPRFIVDPNAPLKF